MTRLHPVRARQAISLLLSRGFGLVRQRGSHKFFRHPDGRTATVPDHPYEDLGRGILTKIFRDAESSPGEFLTWLNR